ncbi:glycosyltransferase family 2 protein [Flavobacterium aciduliphilum]|uniref:Glycosyltransferase involved in cell wall biosynthesis n=1 Tax=Flavobacterium aciduliphilum TaxID=1101402 RepID=A0A328YPQ1_9FLAO|nr:glycosyltransferase family 2 protein [Flavobacterium aciduliphilum]RAR75334.1 glycosyltransferase involved in cell wall biosynthesis [Flavobacterium aciduliphilum]
MNKELSIVMPCLNEAETLEFCIKKAQDYFHEYKIDGEVVIADNGSTDGSQAIAIAHGARVVTVSEKGYGSALKGGFENALGTYIIMGDADDSYDFSQLNPFIEKLREGYDVVIGNRFKGGIEKGAMPFLHRYLGNPVLSCIGRVFFNSKIGDFHCGLRGFSAEAYKKMNLTTTGMEFASEMIVKAHLINLKIAEVPTTLKKDGRSRPPHLNTWRDGWRHLRFLLLYSPKWLFLYPGIFLMLFGFICSTCLVSSPIHWKYITFDVQTLLYTMSALFVGFQLVLFYGLTKVFAVTQQLLPKSNRFDTIFKYITLEKGLILGFFLILVGITLTLFAVSFWFQNHFGTLNFRETSRVVIPAAFTIIMGIQIVLFSFFFSILGLKNSIK